MGVTDYRFSICLKASVLADPETLGKAVLVSLLINISAFSYCTLHGFFSPVDGASWMVSLTWTLRHWGVWPVLFPLCLLFMSVMARTGKIWPALAISSAVSLLLFVSLNWMFNYPNQAFVGGLIQQFPIVTGSFLLILLLSILRVEKPTVTEVDAHIKMGNNNAESVIWGKSFRNYVELHTTEGSSLRRSTLKGLLAELNNIELIQIHRSYFVHASCVHKITRRPGGRVAVLLTNGDRVPVGNAYRSALTVFEAR
jgi:hypothetical protein